MDRVIIDGKPANNIQLSDKDKKIIKDAKSKFGMKDDEPFIGFLCTRGSIFPKETKDVENLTEREQLIKKLKEITRH